MKKTIFPIILFIISFSAGLNVQAEEIQLTDYNYVYAKRVFDGFSVVAFSDRYELSNHLTYNKIEEGYLKPNGTMLYCSGDYSVQYGKHSTKSDNIKSKDFFDDIINFTQPVADTDFRYCRVYNVFYPFNINSVGEAAAFDYNGKFITSETEQKLRENNLIKSLNNEEYNTFLKMNSITEESESYRVDRSYSFKSKKINGQIYYALFKKLMPNESAEDFIPTEKPTEKYSEYINKMYKEQMLFNNEMCFFKRGITKLDFGIVLGRMYCKDIGYDIDKFSAENKYVDVNNPYCLLLDKNNILTSNGQLYLNEKEISKKTVYNALNRIAIENNLLSEWSEIRIIQYADTPCSRELAYVETFRLYDLIMQNNDKAYVKFSPKKILDTDSEAEDMFYEELKYGKDFSIVYIILTVIIVLVTIAEVGYWLKRIRTTEEEK